MVDVAQEHPIPLDELASLLKVSVLTVRTWTKPHLRKGKPVLETTLIGRRLYTTRSALQRFSEPRMHTPIPQINRRQQIEASRRLKDEHGIDA